MAHWTARVLDKVMVFVIIPQPFLLHFQSVFGVKLLSYCFPYLIAMVPVSVPRPRVLGSIQWALAVTLFPPPLIHPPGLGATVGIEEHCHSDTRHRKGQPEAQRVPLCWLPFM